MAHAVPQDQRSTKVVASSATAPSSTSTFPNEKRPITTAPLASTATGVKAVAKNKSPEEVAAPTSTYPTAVNSVPNTSDPADDPDATVPEIHIQNHRCVAAGKNSCQLKIQKACG